MIELYRNGYVAEFLIYTHLEEKEEEKLLFYIDSIVCGRRWWYPFEMILYLKLWWANFWEKKSTLNMNEN